MYLDKPVGRSHMKTNEQCERGRSISTVLTINKLSLTNTRKHINTWNWRRRHRTIERLYPDYGMVGSQLVVAEYGII